MENNINQDNQNKENENKKEDGTNEIPSEKKIIDDTQNKETNKQNININNNEIINKNIENNENKNKNLENKKEIKKDEDKQKKESQELNKQNINLNNNEIINKKIENNENKNENLENKNEIKKVEDKLKEKSQELNNENKIEQEKNNEISQENINKNIINIEKFKEKTKSIEKNIELEIKPKIPNNCGHRKMKKVYEEIKAEALKKPIKTFEKKNSKEIDNKEDKDSINNIENINDNPNEEIPETNFTNITEDGGIQKRIIRKGSGTNPSEGKIAFIKFKSKYEDKIFDETEENEPFQFKIGENKVIKGWEIAVKTMKIGEKAEFIMTPEYTYGDKQVNESIPAKSILNYEIELIAIGNNDSENNLENMTYEEKLQWGKLLKSEGVTKFKANDITAAKECFLKSLQFMKTMDPSKEEQKEGVDLFLTILSNLCNCYNKEKEYNSVIQFATIGLNIKLMPKLLSFRAIAYAYNEDFENAQQDLENLYKFFEQTTDDEKKLIEQTLVYVKSILDERKSLYIEKNKKYSRAIFRQYLYHNKSLKNNSLIPPKERNPQNPVVFFEIKIGEKNAGKIEFELFKDITPITAENFRLLCIGEKKELSYKGTCLNKIIKNFVIGGGELDNNNGKNKCIYGEYFDDENYIYCHCRRGLLTMDNVGKNTNNSKFLITLKYLPWFDGKHVVFGQIIEGIEILNEIEELETDNEDRPLIKVIIENCGEIFKKEEIKKKG